MTQKHYIAMARALSQVERTLIDHATGRRLRLANYEDNQLGGFRVAVDVLMEVLRQDNPRFDQERFFTAVFGE